MSDGLVGGLGGGVFVKTVRMRRGSEGAATESGGLGGGVSV